MKTKVFIEKSNALCATNILPHILAMMWVLIVPLLLLSSCRTSQKTYMEEAAYSTTSEQTSSATRVLAFSSMDSLFRLMSLQIDSIVVEFSQAGETAFGSPSWIDTMQNRYVFPDTPGGGSWIDSTSGQKKWNTSAPSMTSCHASMKSKGLRLPRDGLRFSPYISPQANNTGLARVKISGVRLNTEESLTKNVDTSVCDSFTQTAHSNTQSSCKEEKQVSHESFPLVKAIGWLTIAIIMMIALVLIIRKKFL